MSSRGVDCHVIGEFNNSDRCKVNFNGENIMDLEMDFLHNGLPKKTLKTIYTKHSHSNPKSESKSDLTETLHEMLSRPNLCSYSFISRQFDHEVQGGAVLKPVQGKGEVNAVASVSKPLFDSNKGVVCSYGINPTYSDIDTYHMAASAIDTAIRNAVAVGAPLSHMALMDNFCWCSSNEEERLGQLKAAAKACYDYAVKYGTPYISGKDSMFNDFTGFNKEGKQIKISVPPTLLVSSIAVIEDVTKSVSLDPKFVGDLVYILGETKCELGASEYFAYLDEKNGETGNIGNTVPQVDAEKATTLYNKFEQAVNSRLITSSLSPALGGLGVTLAKKAIAGQLGMQIDLSKIPGEDFEREDYKLFSESQSRFIVTIDPNKKEEFEKAMEGTIFAEIGKMTEDQNFKVKGLRSNTIINTTVKTLDEHYKKTFKNY